MTTTMMSGGSTRGGVGVVRAIVIAEPLLPRSAIVSSTLSSSWRAGQAAPPLPSSSSSSSQQQQHSTAAAVAAAQLCYPLAPVAPSSTLPFALLPVCNVPLIDYVLESLVEGGVDDVTVLLSSSNGSAAARVTAHLQNNRTARGTTWTTCDALKVRPVECAGRLSSLADAVREVRERDVVPQGSSLLFVPIDSIAVLPRLRECVRVHLDRVRSIAKYAATLLCVEDGHELRSTLCHVLTQGSRHQQQLLQQQQHAHHAHHGGKLPQPSLHSAAPSFDMATSSSSTTSQQQQQQRITHSYASGGSHGRDDSVAASAATAAAASSSSSGGGGGGDGKRALRSRTAVQRYHKNSNNTRATLLSRIAATRPLQHHTMFVLDKATGVVSYMARAEAPRERRADKRRNNDHSSDDDDDSDDSDDSDDDAAALEPPLVVFRTRARQSVRMDLVPTDYLICQAEALALVEFHIRDVYDFLSVSLLANTAVYGNVFGVLPLPSHAATIAPLTSLSAYVQANIDVAARRLYPLTRESCFADAQARYAIAPSCDTVYVHTAAKLHSSAAVGPHCVLGADVVVPATARLTAAVLGARVLLGDGCVVVNSVVLDGAVVGQRCVVRDSLIGLGAVLEDGVEVVDCIVGNDCVVRAHRVHHTSEDGGDDKRKSAPTTLPTVLRGQVAIACDGQKHTAAAAADGACGGDDDEVLVLPYKCAHAIVPTSTLFVHDPPPQRARGEDSDSDSGSDSSSDGGTRSSKRSNSNSNSSSSSTSTLDDLELFQRAIRRHLATALQQPSSHIAASAYDMSSVCLSHGYGYPELCEVVTEGLLQHAMTTRGGGNNGNGSNAASAADADAIVEVARELFAQWARPFYNAFLSKNDEMHVEAMVATIEGLCAAIASPSCVLHCHGPVLVEVLYNGCDDELYDARDYCIVSGEALVRFDEVMRRRRQLLLQQRQHKRQKPPPRHHAAMSDEDSDDSDDEDDALEAQKLLVAESCHEYIMGVKAYLEGK